MNYIVYLLLSVVVNEALVELLKSGFFEKLRNFLNNKNNCVCSFLFKVITCGYCSSVWTAAFITLVSFVFITPVLINCIFLDIIISFILIHRLSNFLHDFCDRYISKYVLMANKE